MRHLLRQRARGDERHADGGRLNAPSGLGLRGIELFGSLSPEELEALARQCAWRTYEPGRHIISREANDRDLHLLVSGRVRVTAYSASGRQVTFTDIPAAEIVGDIAAIDEGPRSADVLALESSLVACMPTAVFRRLLDEEPAVAARLLRRLTGVVRRLSERVFDLSTLGVQNRIHAELLRLARRSRASGNAARIDPAPKHADIASQVSTYREQVTRELSALARAGLVGRDRGALLVRDLKRLEHMVEEVKSGA